MNIVEYAVEQYLQGETDNDREFAVRLQAVPIYRGWTGTVFLTAAGEFLFRDEESEPCPVRAESDPATQIVALATGVERFPILVNLLPERHGTRQDCADCDGTGRVYPRNATSWMYCGVCHGLGWSGRLSAPLSIPDCDATAYPEFDVALARFLSFARAEGLTGDSVFITHDDVVSFRGALYIHVREQTAARARAQHAYAAAARRRLGVVIAAAARLSPTSTAVYVYGPENPDEAERLMFPDGLKMSVPQAIDTARIVNAATAFALSLLRGRRTATGEERNRRLS